MSKNEFDELLLKKFNEAELAYNPANWDKLSQLLPLNAVDNKEFDALLSRKLQENELEYNPGHWDTMARMLPASLVPVIGKNTLIPRNKVKRWGLAAGIAAMVIVMGTTIVLRNRNNSLPVDPAQQTLAQEPPAKNTIRPIPQNIPRALQPPTNKTANLAQQNRPSNITLPNKQSTRNSVQNNIFGNNNNLLIPGNTNTTPQQIAQNNIPSPITKTNEDNNKPIEGQASTNIPSVKEELNQNNYTYNNNNDFYASNYYEGKGNGNKNPKTSISVGGGVNYGNLNTGYTAGVSVRRKVAGDFFVDGTVAMMYNNNANNVAVNNGPSLGDMGNAAARPSSFSQSSLASPALDPIQKLYYVQFNPSIGYQVEKHVALSVGGDFQQMLNKKDEIVQPGNNNSKVFPNFDVGLTTKSEFSITPNIQAGLIYREGLNNLIKNDGSKYVNRRYVQVQFKYNIPVN